MINPGLNVNQTFIKQVEKYIFNTFGEIKRPFIKATLAKNNKSVLALIMIYEKISDKKYYTVLSCDIYTIIKIMSVLII